MFLKKKADSVHALIMAQINDVENCFINFESFVRAACIAEPSFETLGTLRDSICKAEAEADKSLRRMIDSLVGGTYLPSTREEIIDIATNCDRIANKCEGFAKMVVIQKFKFPADYQDDLLEVVAIVHSQVKLLEESISKLFSDFSALLKDHSILDDIRHLESKVDVIEEKLYEKTYALDMGLAERMQIARFVDGVCNISDIVENLADRIQIMLVTRKA